MATIAEKTARMHNPAHPGEILREMYLKPLGVTVTQAAKALGVTRKHVSAIVNGRAPVTPDMALRLAAASATDPELWVNMQAQYDLWTVSKQAHPNTANIPMHYWKAFWIRHRQVNGVIDFRSELNTQTKTSFLVP